MIDSAMTASTGGPGATIHPTVAAASVTLWATVNDVIAVTSRQRSRMRSTSASTNSRWSTPARMCSTPSVK